MQVISGGKTAVGPPVRALLALGVALFVFGTAAAGELSVDDFSFDGPSGSQGATIERVGQSHFKVTLGHAPGWC